jgi:RNA polymerase sigma factor (sigma-70 family)
MTQDDLANEARIAFTKAVAKHDRTRPGVARYAHRYMHSAALRWLTTWNERPASPVRETSEDGPPHMQHLKYPRPAPEHDLLDELEREWGFDRLADVVADLPESQQDLFTRRFMLDDTLMDIAEDSECTESAVSRRMRTALRAVERELMTLDDAITG